jgi:hypothetical protein
MLRLFKKVIYGLRTQGPGYLVRAPLNELAHPRLPITRALRRVMVSLSRRFSRSPSNGQHWSAGALQFVFDLSVAPLTFDFISYLAAAELVRRRKGLDHIDVVFVAGGHLGVRKESPEYEEVVTVAMRSWRLRNILIPSLALLPSVRSYGYCASREQARALVAGNDAHIYPPEYLVGLPSQPVKSVIHELARQGEPVWPILHSTDGARTYVAKFFDEVTGGRRAIVISLRNYGFSPARNSRVEEWTKFADSLDPTRYVAIFVPDTEDAITAPAGKLGGHPICVAASWNLEIRMALYEAAWLNMGVMHGPMELCWYNEKVWYVIFINHGADDINSVAALTEHGHRIGCDLDFATPHQHIVWGPDMSAGISAAFVDFERNHPL